jgi:hypothetical protein
MINGDVDLSRCVTALITDRACTFRMIHANFLRRWPRRRCERSVSNLLRRIWDRRMSRLWPSRANHAHGGHDLN